MRHAALRLAPFLALLLAWPALAQDGFFQTPSGNIQCLGAEGFVDCEIIRSETAPPQPRPFDCDLDWGTRFGVGETGPGVMPCHGDTLRGQGYPVLGYGRSATFGSVTCTSQERGLECVNRDGGGFLLSRRDQRLF